MKHLAIALFFMNALNATPIDNNFFDRADAFFAKEVKSGLLDYEKLQSDSELSALIDLIETADLSEASKKTKIAFYINAYNLHVIQAAASAYPIESVQSVSGFFDNKRITVAQKLYTLNTLEKEALLKPYKDARLHFVLVCGANGCPPITNFAYRPEQLDMQLDQQTRLAINNPTFLHTAEGKTELSQIFNWYASDFGGSKSAIIDFINTFRNTPISSSSKINYYPYDWSLNDGSQATSLSNPIPAGGNNTARYIVSSTIAKGSSEIKIFNNLYTQRTGNDGQLTDRSTFLTTSLSYLYGLSNRFNVGISTRYRRVQNSRLPSSALDVFQGGSANSFRQGLTAFGPQIRYAPVPKWSNFSVQSSLVFPIGSELTGNGNLPFIDWNGPTWWTQFFNDFPIGQNFSLFTEIDVLIEDIGNSAEGHNNRFSTPATLIFSYNPNRKTTLYALGGFSPFWQSEFDYFSQLGLGGKYQFTPNFELELLFTDFTNQFLDQSGGQAATYNLGFRFNINN